MAARKEQPGGGKAAGRRLRSAVGRTKRQAFTPPPMPLPAPSSAAPLPLAPEHDVGLSFDVMSAESVEAVMPALPDALRRRSTSAPGDNSAGARQPAKRRAASALARRLSDALKSAPNLRRTERRNSGKARVEFEVLLERGINAMLMRDLPQAWDALSAAGRIDPAHAIVQANLKRLRDLGFEDS